jgi:hypothetical protein
LGVFIAFQKTTPELATEVLRICGERDDGYSPFNDQVISFLNDVYQGVLAGGNLFGIDVAENWNWAEVKRPTILTLLPVNQGSCTLTQDSASGTFSSAPSISLEGRVIALEGEADMYRIAQHTAASASFQLDAPFILASDSYNYSAHKMDYQAINDSIVIDSYNNKIDFTEGGGELTATLTAGTYTPTTLCTEIDTRMTAAGAQAYTVAFNSITRKFTIAQGGATFTMKFATGTNAHISASEILGYECLDYSGALTYTSPYALSGVLRITKPLSTYQDSSLYSDNAKEASKIFFSDANAFMRDYPLSRIQGGMPDRFTISEQRSNGLLTLRMNASMNEDKARVEMNYIPIHRSLQDNAGSIPRLPTPYTKFLVYGASYHLLMDKNDDKAEKYAAMAQAELKAMINDNRKTGVAAGNNFGKLIARPNPRSSYGYGV